MISLFLTVQAMLPFASSLIAKPSFAAQAYDGKYYNTKEMLDFSDSTEEEIDGYYQDVGTRKGKEFQEYLYQKISCKTEEIPKYYLPYGSGIQGVSKWYQITDRSWSISEEIKPETFRFITSSKDPRCSKTLFYNMYMSEAANNDPKKTYSTLTNGYKVDSTITGFDYQNQRKGNSLYRIDKEHIWAKSHGFEVMGDTFVPGAQTDLHHLVAADGNTNSAGHNNYSYGEVDKSKAKVIQNYLADGTNEISGYLDTKSLTFEPTDEWKGDVARALFYMATRYSKKLEPNTKAEPYLILTDDTTIQDDNGKCHGVQYNLSTLLKWNEKDPVSSYEIHRNNLIYHNVQNNRNPFIDHPEWAKRIYSPSHFSAIQDNYNLHVDDKIDLGLEDFQNVNVKIEPEGIVEVKDNSITAKAPGTCKVTFDYDDEIKTVEIEVKDVLSLKKEPEEKTFLLNDNTTLDLNSLFTLQNNFKDEKLNYVSQDERIFTVDENGILKTGYISGKANLEIYLIKNKEKTLFKTYEVTNTLSKKTMFILIGLLLVILVVLIILIVIFSKMSKKKRKKALNQVKKAYKKTTKQNKKR